ncbi:MAG: GNAT family N-acetyltransferase [Deltaproteobacteria bacterium]|nr:GNAT family N-acetyltransferase [Deltaproteobacteria bacterium]
MSHAARLSLRRLTVADLDVVVAVYGGVPSFFELLIGRREVPREYVRDEMLVGPPGHEKVFLGLDRGGEIVGAADVLPTYPAVGAAWIGVFLVSEAHQRRGVGRAGVALVEQYAASRGARQVSLGVELVNAAGRAFWIACGYHPTGELFDTDVLGTALRAEVLRKQLR